MKFPKGFSTVFLVVCFAGFAFQTLKVSNIFFAYKTTSKIEIVSTDQLQYPSLVFCTRYLDVIDRSQRNRFPGIGVDIPTSDDKVHDELSVLTTKEIFELTPKIEDSLVNCSLRSTQTEMLVQISKEECMKKFHLIKYITGEDVCYMYISDKDLVYSLTKVTTSLTEVGVVFKLHLSDQFNKAIHLTLISSICSAERMTKYLDDLTMCTPVISRKYSERIIREIHSGQPSNFFVIQGTVHNITLLQDPYETSCKDGQEPQFCFMKCVIQGLKETVNRYPFSEIITSNDSLKILSTRDLQKQDIFLKVQEVDDKCHEACNHRQCLSYYTLTEAAEYATPEGDETLILVAGVPKSNGITVKTLAFMTLIEYINHVCVSGSIWLGVSVLSAFPGRLFDKKHLRKMRLRMNDRKNKMNTARSWQSLQIHKKSRVSIVPRLYCPCNDCRRHFKGFAKDSVIGYTSSVNKRVFK